MRIAEAGDGISDNMPHTSITSDKSEMVKLEVRLLSSGVIVTSSRDEILLEHVENLCGP